MSFMNDLVCYYGTRSSSSIGRDDDSAIEYASNNRGTGTCGSWKRNSSGMESYISIMVGKIKAGHDCTTGLVRMMKRL